jgi:L-ascorbate metabolism protein UlaG (beta-lactamase superfamily)
VIQNMRIGRRAFLGAAAAASGGVFSPGALARDAGPAPAGLVLERLAWAGLRLEFGSVALFVDAINPDPQSGRPGPSLQTHAARSFALVTHHHPDHCDPAALAPLLGTTGYLVAQESVLAQFDHRSLNVQPTRTFEPVFLSRGAGEFVAWAVPASDGLGSPQFSWVIDAGGKRIIHCGDTAWHGGWWDIGRAYGPFDVAFLPINGFRQTGGRFREAPAAMSLTPEQAVHAAKILGANLAVPIHFGLVPDASYTEEPDALARFVREASAQSVRVRTLAPGESLSL